jgi:hypothetical protein
LPHERNRLWTKQNLILARVGSIAALFILVAVGMTIVVLQLTGSLRQAAAVRGGEATVRQEEIQAASSVREPGRPGQGTEAANEE